MKGANTQSPGDIEKNRPGLWQKLSFRMSVGIVAILGFILILIGRIAIHEQRRYMLDQLNDYGAEMSEFVAEISIIPLRKYSIYQLENFVARLEKGRLITYCEIYDEKENPLAHPSGETPQIKKHDPEEILIFKRDIVDEGETIGRVEIRIDPEPVISRIEKASAYIERAFILELIIIALAVNFFIHRSFVAPFIRLTRVTEAIAVGIFTTSDQANRNDEIGWLAKSINSMSHKLRESYQDLERKVLERTSKLAEANAKLGESVDTLALRNRETQLFKRCIEELQLCETRKDTDAVLLETCSRLFQNDRGCITGIDAESGEHFILGFWGEGSLPEFGFLEDECLAVTNKHLHVCFNPELEIACRHNQKIASPGFCVPMIVQGDVLGVLHIICEGNEVEPFISKQKLGENLIQQYTLFLNNLQLRHTLQQQSIRDPLTGMFNRRFMEETLKRESLRAKRDQFSIGIIMADVDRFKHFNDTYGHDVGDTVLKKLSKMLQSGIRGADVVCRYGGEEFILILPNATLDQTMTRAEEIRSHVEMNMGMTLRGEEVKITVSLGVSVYDAAGDHIEDVIRAADRALYAAKAAGRNVVRSARG